MWRAEDVTLTLLEGLTSDPIVTIEITVPGGLIIAMAEPLVVDRTLVARRLHMHGEGIGTNMVGAANLMVLAGVVMEELGYDGLVVEGAARTTGANPTHRPRPLRFTRRARADPGSDPG